MRSILKRKGKNKSVNLTGLWHQIVLSIFCCWIPISSVLATLKKKIKKINCTFTSSQTLLETNLGRLQVELYKELKKNGASRSLRAALWRFADMCHLIRPQKCRCDFSSLRIAQYFFFFFQFIKCYNVRKWIIC